MKPGSSQPPAVVPAEPVMWRQPGNWLAYEAEQKALWARGDAGERAEAAKLTEPLYATPPVAAAPADIDALVNRFLSWPVPASVYPDGTPGKPGRTGTNLLSALEAREMLEYVLKGGHFFKANAAEIAKEQGMDLS